MDEESYHHPEGQACDTRTGGPVSKGELSSLEEQIIAVDNQTQAEEIFNILIDSIKNNKDGT